MTKKDGKWTTDTSSKNYDLKDMARTSVEALDTNIKGSFMTRTFFLRNCAKEKKIVK